MGRSRPGKTFVRDGIQYLTEGAEFFENGMVRDATLAKDSLIQDIPCLGGRDVVFYPSGNIKLVWLRCTANLRGIACAGKSLLYLHENGTPLNSSLANDQIVDGHSLTVGTRVTMDEDGVLIEYSTALKSDQVVEGIPCCANFHVWQYADGRPSLVVLAAPHVIDGILYPRGTQLTINEWGSVLHSQAVDVDSGQQYKQRAFGAYEQSWL